MKRLLLTMVFAVMAGVAAMADNTSTVFISGQTAGTDVVSISFEGDNVSFSFADGTEKTADMAAATVEFTYDSIDTGIQETLQSHSPERIFSLSGQYLGTSTDRLEKGIYIVGGKKFIKK